jgi:hypothetical protein
MTAQQTMPTPGPNHAPRRPRALRCTDPVGAHHPASNHDTTSMRCPTENKESQ